MLEREFDFEIHLDGDELYENHHVSIFNQEYYIELYHRKCRHDQINGNLIFTEVMTVSHRILQVHLLICRPKCTAKYFFDTFSRHQSCHKIFQNIFILQEHHSEKEHHYEDDHSEIKHDHHRHHHHHDHAHDDHQIAHEDRFDALDDHAHHSEHHVSLKFYFIISAILFFGCFITLYMIPLLSKLKKDSRNNSKQQVITQVLNCLGAGVLLGLALLDILPELRESISSISSEKDIHYPLGNDLDVHRLSFKSTRTRYTVFIRNIG